MRISDIRRYDSEKMYETYEKWPEIAEENYQKVLPKTQFRNVNHIVFAGVGGSGTIGDVMSSILSKTNKFLNEPVTSERCVEAINIQNNKLIINYNRKFFV